MREFEIKPQLQKKLQKLLKKDKILYEAILTKIEEILVVQDVTHYKNLKNRLKEFKRVHVKSSFVLLFQHNADDSVSFFDVAHHDDIYK